MEETKVLIVEDEVIVADDLRITLESRGYGVAVASSGEDALQQVAEMGPDLVLMDIGLRGDLDGIETAEQIHTHFDIPVIFVTAYADDERAQRAKVTEPFGYVLKPFDGRELHLTMQMALYKHEMERRVRESERELRLIVGNMRDAIFAYDMNRQLQYVSPAFEALTGYTTDELYEQNFINYLHPDDEVRMMRQWEDLFRGKPFSGEEFRILTKGIFYFCLPTSKSAVAKSADGA